MTGAAECALQKGVVLVGFVGWRASQISELTALPHAPQLLGSAWRLKHEVPHVELPAGQTDVIAVAVTVVVVTGVEAVVVLAVMPQQEQALL